jgi:hypothetical protein
MATTVRRPAGRPSGQRIVGAAAIAGVVSVAVNLVIRAVVLALLVKPEVPYPLVLPPVVEFTFLPCLLGAAVFLILRRFTTRPLRWFTVAAATVVVLSWAGPLILFLGDDITIGVMLVLLVMHITPAVVLVATLSHDQWWRRPE